MGSLGLSLGLGLGGAAGGASTLTQLKALLAGSAKSGIWTPTDLTTAFSDNGVTPVTSGGQIKQLNDVSGNGNHMSQATSGKRPVATNGLTFDGLDDFIGFVFSGGAGSSNMTVLMGVRTVDTEFAMGSDISGLGGSNYFGLGQASSSSTIIGTIGAIPFVGGISFSGQTRGSFSDAISNNVWHIVESRAGEFSPMTGIGFANLLSSGSYKLNGAMSCIVLIDNLALGATNAAAALTLAQQLIDTTNGALP